MMYLWGYIEKKGAWISFDEDILKEIKQKEIECPDKVQGDNKLLELFESNGNLKEYFYNTINKIFENEKE